MPRQRHRKTHPKKFVNSLETIDENTPLCDPEGLRQHRNEALINVGTNIAMAAIFGGTGCALGQYGASRLCSKNPKCSFMGVLLTSTFFIYRNFKEGLSSEDDKTKAEFLHVKNLATKPIRNLIYGNENQPYITR
jgi:hypothetical protein